MSNIIKVGVILCILIVSFFSGYKYNEEASSNEYDILKDKNDSLISVLEIDIIELKDSLTVLNNERDSLTNNTDELINEIQELTEIDVTDEIINEALEWIILNNTL